MSDYQRAKSLHKHISRPTYMYCTYICTHISCRCIRIFMLQPPRNTWQTDLGEVQPMWLEVRLPSYLFWVLFLPTIPPPESLTQLSTPLSPFPDSSEGTHPEQAAVLWTTMTSPVCKPQLWSQAALKYLTVSLG